MLTSIWMQLPEEFEGISNTLDRNLFKRLSKIAMSVKDEKNKDSILQALKQRLSKELTNVDKAFLHVLSLANHLITSGGALGIKKLAKALSKRAKA
eukprot:806727-Rhodomonas_salina.3